MSGAFSGIRIAEGVTIAVVSLGLTFSAPLTPPAQAGSQINETRGVGDIRLGGDGMVWVSEAPEESSGREPKIRTAALGGIPRTLVAIPEEKGRLASRVLVAASSSHLAYVVSRTASDDTVVSRELFAGPINGPYVTLARCDRGYRDLPDMRLDLDGSILASVGEPCDGTIARLTVRDLAAPSSSPVWLTDLTDVPVGDIEVAGDYVVVRILPTGKRSKVLLYNWRTGNAVFRLTAGDEPLARYEYEDDRGQTVAPNGTAVFTVHNSRGTSTSGSSLAWASPEQPVVHPILYPGGGPMRARGGRVAIDGDGARFAFIASAGGCLAKRPDRLATTNLSGAVRWIDEFPRAGDENFDYGGGRIAWEGGQLGTYPDISYPIFFRNLEVEPPSEPPAGAAEPRCPKVYPSKVILSGPRSVPVSRSGAFRLSFRCRDFADPDKDTTDCFGFLAVRTARRVKLIPRGPAARRVLGFAYPDLQKGQASYEDIRIPERIFRPLRRLGRMRVEVFEWLFQRRRVGKKVGALTLTFGGAK